MEAGSQGPVPNQWSRGRVACELVAVIAPCAHCYSNKVTKSAFRWPRKVCDSVPRLGKAED